MSFSMRPVEAGDWEFVKEIRLKALDLHPDLYGAVYAEEVEMDEAEWREWVMQHAGAIAILLEDSQVVGLTGIIVNKNDSVKKHAVLWGSWLEPKLHRHGFMKMLYEGGIGMATKNEVAKLLLPHHATDTEMQAFAQQQGFAPAGQGEGASQHYEMHLAHTAELTM